MKEARETDQLSEWRRLKETCKDRRVITLGVSTNEIWICMDAWNQKKSGATSMETKGITSKK